MPNNGKKKPIPLSLPSPIRDPHKKKSYHPSSKNFPALPQRPQVFILQKESEPCVTCSLKPCVSLGHVWATFSKLNFITCHIFQPLKNYSIPGLIYDIISKQVASSALLLFQNDAGCAPEDGVASRRPQPLVCTGNEHKDKSTFEHWTDSLCHTWKHVSWSSVQQTTY